MVHLSISGYWFICQSAEEPIGSSIISERTHWFISQSAEEPIVSSTNWRKSLLVHLPIDGRAHWFIYQSAEKPLVHPSAVEEPIGASINRRKRLRFIYLSAEEPIGSSLNWRKSLLFFLPIGGRAFWFIYQSTEKPLRHLPIGGIAKCFIYQLAEKPVGSSTKQRKNTEARRIRKTKSLNCVIRALVIKGFSFISVVRNYNLHFDPKSASVHECYKRAVTQL